ncbi:MAG: glycosyltransferase, partial [Candidatus Saccharimonadales bacterium]
MARTTGSRKHSFDIVEPGFTHQGQEYVHHSGLRVKDTAFQRLLPRQGIVLGLLAAAIAASFIADWHATLLTLIALLTIYYIFQIVFDLFLTYRSLSGVNESIVSDQEIKDHRGGWPAYTILCPLYREEVVLPQFVRAMEKLDYPVDKLQILLLLEEDDQATIKAAKKMKLSKQFQVVVVPHSLPKTKPKALNYGLKKAAGEYVVIYDAEDIPEPKQLKRTALAFSKADPSVACVQSKLDYYNPRQNVLTRVFTAEYALWFDLVLPGLQSIKAPIPLGGTSNHFQVELLKELGGWDAFNVTEDA